METKLIILLFLATIVVYWLLGFLPGLPIKPKNNRWHAWGPFDQIWGYIDGDKKRLLPISLPPPFNKVFRSVTYTKFVDDNDLTDHSAKSIDGKTIHYHEVKAEDIMYGAKAQVRKVTEEITRLRKTESHPYVVKVLLPKVAGTFFFIFTLKIKMKNPMKALLVDEFLVLIGNQLHDRFSPWAIAYEAHLFEGNNNPDEQQKKLSIIDKLIGLSIDDEDSVMLKISEPGQPAEDINLHNYMNRVVAKYGGFIEDNGMDLDIGYDINIKKILDKRNEQINQGEQTKLEEQKNLTENVIRARRKADKTQEIELAKKEQDEVTIPLIKEQAEAAKKANEAWGQGGLGTLVLGDQKPGLLVQSTPNTKKQGGTNATT